MVLSKTILAASAAASLVLVCKSRTISAASPAPKYELRQVQVVFRHGARTPLHVPSYIPPVTYEKSLLDHAPKTLANIEIVPLSVGTIILPTSPFEESYHRHGTLKGGCYPGQLTNIGAEQTYDLGAILRKKYVSDMQFLDPSELSEQIFIRSTNMGRTVSSARCVLSGLLGGQHTDEPHKIYVAPPDDEILYPNYYTCVHLRELVRWAWDDPDKLPGITKVKDSFRELLSIPADAKLDLITLRDNFAVEATHKKPSMKDLLSEDAVKRLEKSAIQIMEGAFIGVEEVRGTSLKLAIGAFVDELLLNMEKESNGTCNSKEKIRLYSGHDTTLIPLLGALGIKILTWPQYAGNVILELYRKDDVHARDGDEGEHFVKLYYNGEPQSIGKCGKDEPCPLSEFQRAVEHVRLSFSEYKKLCHVN